jgi:hypothetical protein
MLFRSKDLDAIVAGTRTLAFRRWKRTTVKAGGTVRTPRGLVGIDSITVIDPASVTEAEARAAGYRDRASLMAMFEAQEGTCYLIRLRYAGPDHREALAQDADLDEAARAGIHKRLERLDKASPDGPWTAKTLRLIADNPGVVAAELAALAGRERDAFKQSVRRLKSLGLTISLSTGYRLSPRGKAWLGE